MQLDRAKNKKKRKTVENLNHNRKWKDLNTHISLIEVTNNFKIHEYGGQIIPGQYGNSTGVSEIVFF